MGIFYLALVVLLLLAIMKAMLLHGMLKVKEDYTRYIPILLQQLAACTLISFSILVSRSFLFLFSVS